MSARMLKPLRARGTVAQRERRIHRHARRVALRELGAYLDGELIRLGIVTPDEIAAKFPK